MRGAFLNPEITRERDADQTPSCEKTLYGRSFIIVLTDGYLNICALGVIFLPRSSQFL